MSDTTSKALRMDNSEMMRGFSSSGPVIARGGPMGHLFPHIRWQDELPLEMRTVAYGAGLVSLGSFVAGILTVVASAVLGHLLNERWPDVNWKEGLQICFLLLPTTFVLTFGPILVLYRRNQKLRPWQ